MRISDYGVHFSFGADELRQLEISANAKTLVKRSKQEDEVYVFLGDMNIDTPEGNTMLALTNRQHEYFA